MVIVIVVLERCDFIWIQNSFQHKTTGNVF